MTAYPHCKTPTCFLWPLSFQLPFVPVASAGLFTACIRVSLHMWYHQTNNSTCKKNVLFRWLQKAQWFYIHLHCYYGLRTEITLTPHSWRLCQNNVYLNSLNSVISPISSKFSFTKNHPIFQNGHFRMSISNLPSTLSFTRKTKLW